MFHATYKEFQPIQNEKDYDKLIIVSEFGEGLIYDKETKTLSLNIEKIKEMIINEIQEQRISEG